MKSKTSDALQRRTRNFTPNSLKLKQNVSPSLAWLRNTKSAKNLTHVTRSLFRQRLATPVSVYQDSTYHSTPALNIEQRKTLLVDRMEHRVLESDITSKTGYTILIALTVLSSLVIRILDIQYYLEERNDHVNPRLYQVYDFSTWCLPSLPLWFLLATTLWEHRAKMHRISCCRSTPPHPTHVSNTTRCHACLEWVVTLGFLCTVLPMWMIVGEILWSLKLFGLGKHITKTWWSVLALVGLPTESDTTSTAHLRMNHVCATDFKNLSHSPLTPLASFSPLSALQLTPSHQKNPCLSACSPVTTTTARSATATTTTATTTPLSTISQNSSAQLSNNRYRTRQRILSEHTPGEDAQLGKENERTTSRLCHEQQQQEQEQQQQLVQQKLVSPLPPRPPRPPRSARQHIHPRLLVSSIQKKALLRRKKLAAAALGGNQWCLFCIAMPRFDLTFDVVTLNKMVLLELVFK